MARTNRELDRDQKREEILRAARELFLEHGYEGTSMQRLAARVKVAPNTIYWYCADKDALLIGVMKRVVQAGLGEYERRRGTALDAQVRWMLGLFWETRTLIATVHNRAQVSSEVRAWHDTAHRMIEKAIEAELRSRGLANGHEVAAARIMSFIAEGVVAHQSSKAEQTRIVRLLMHLLRLDVDDGALR